MGLQEYVNNIRWCDNIYERHLSFEAMLIIILQQKASFDKWMHKYHSYISKMDFISQIRSIRPDITCVILYK